MEKLAGEPLTLEQNPRWAAQTEAGRARRGLSPEGHLAVSGAQGKGPCWAHSACRAGAVSAAAEPLLCFICS